MSSFISSSRPRLFVLLLLAAVLATGITGLAAAAYFTATGDLLDEATAAAIQRQGGPDCTYASLATNNHAAFKYAAYAERRPRIVALGSSRVLQFSGRLFSRPFYNLGRAMSSLADGPVALDVMKRFGKPDVVLLGLDHWLFSAAHVPSAADDGSVRRTDRLAVSQLLKLMGTVLRRPDLLVGPDRLLDGPPCPIGMSGLAYHSGFAPDGFYYYGERLMTPAAQQEDYEFRDSLRRVESGSRRFEHGDAPDPARIRAAAELIAQLRAEGIVVVAFLPPVAPTVHAAMARSGGYRYIAGIGPALARQGVAIHDFFDPVALGLSDCDFADGFHAGDSAHARLLAELARREPVLEPFLDRAEVRRVGGKNGRAMVYFAETFGVAETDFLGLGCAK